MNTKRTIAVALLLCLLSGLALADQADDLIATFTDASKASVQIALVTADANHRQGQPYTFKLRTQDGTQEYTLTEEEYEKLKLWVEGKYNPVPIRRDVSAQESTTDWMDANGYTFPVYGATSADLSPISDYLTLLAQHKIYLSLPELQISAKEEYDWISSSIADNFWLLYRPYHDGSRYVILLELPYTYLPMDEAFPLLLVSVLSTDETEAADIFATLKYNIINETCEIRADNYTVTYSEPRLSNGKLADFAVLEVEKKLN